MDKNRIYAILTMWIFLTLLFPALGKSVNGTIHFSIVFGLVALMVIAVSNFDKIIGFIKEKLSFKKG